MFRNKKVMKVSAAQIAELIDGKIEGEPSVLVSGPAKIEEGMPGAISFWAMTNTNLIFSDHLEM